MSRKATIAVAVVFAFSAVAQAQTSRSRSSRAVRKAPARSSAKAKAPAKSGKVRVQIRPGSQPRGRRQARGSNRFGHGSRHNSSRRQAHGSSNRFGHGSSSRHSHFDRNQAHGSNRFGHGSSSRHSHFDRNHHQHQYREWAPPVYGYREVEVWVPPVYRTVHDGCHCDSHGRIGVGVRIGGNGLGIQIGDRHHCEGRRILVREGYYDHRIVRYVVREGYWRTRSSCLSCGHARIGIRFRIGF